jgi:hypothetical protein
MNKFTNLNKFIQIINSNQKKHDKLIKILEIIFQDAKINKKTHFIMGSYALRESREINDLDVVMEPDQFIKLEQLDYGQVTDFEGRKKFSFDLIKDFSIEIFRKEKTVGYPNYEFSLAYLRKNDCLDIDEHGNMHYNLHTLLKWKETVDRQKDKKDIEMIKEILDNN